MCASKTEPEPGSSSKIHKVLANPIRVAILNTIAEGAISFTSLKEVLNLSDGSLFYHLKMLKRYIVKDQQNYYKLSEEGRALINEIQWNKQILKTDTGESTHESKFFKVFGLSNFHYYMIGDPLRSIIELNVSLIVLSWLFGVTGSHFSFIEKLFSGGAIANGLISLAHWYIYIIVIFLVVKSLKKEVIFRDIWIIVMNGIVPYFIYLIPTALFYYLNMNENPTIAIITNIIFVICKLWSILIIGKGISIVTRMHPTVGILIALILTILDYAYMMALLL